jgi:hypothetical protein
MAGIGAGTPGKNHVVFLVFPRTLFRARSSHAAASFDSVTTPIPVVALIPHARNKLATIQFNQTAVHRFGSTVWVMQTGPAMYFVIRAGRHLSVSSKYQSKGGRHCRMVDTQECNSSAH